jgi:hypothetical protein
VRGEMGQCNEEESRKFGEEMKENGKGEDLKTARNGTI